MKTAKTVSESSLGEWRFQVLDNGVVRVQYRGGSITIGSNYPGAERRPGTLILHPTPRGTFETS